MTKESNGNFKISTKCWICDNDCIGNDVKVIDPCHITVKFRGSAHRNYNINLKLNQKNPVVFHNLKTYDSHLVIQELRKLNVKVSVTPNGLELYLSFTINNQLSFIDSFEFQSFPLESLVKNLSQDYFKFLSQEFGNNILDLVK